MSSRFGTGARAAALLAFGALGLHELRYLAAYGGDAPAALGAQGHGYLETAAPILALVAAASLAATPVALALAGERSGRPRPLHRALVFTLALFTVFTAQELAEGALSAGHSGGIAAVLGGGGWIAIPLAIVFGSLAALATAALERLDAAIAAVVTRRRTRRDRESANAAPSCFADDPLATRNLAFGFARRPPPRPLPG